MERVFKILIKHKYGKLHKKKFYESEKDFKKYFEQHTKRFKGIYIVEGYEFINKEWIKQ